MIRGKKSEQGAGNRRAWDICGQEAVLLFQMLNWRGKGDWVRVGESNGKADSREKPRKLRRAGGKPKSQNWALRCRTNVRKETQQERRRRAYQTIGRRGREKEWKEGGKCDSG